MAEKRKLIFDCDTGTDDAVALAAVLLSGKADVLGITSVRGNIPVDCVVDNNLRLTEFLGFDVPVYRGCHRAMTRTLTPGRDSNAIMEVLSKSVGGNELRIHDLSLPLPETTRRAESENACSFIVDTLLSSDEPVDIAAVGPLTNLGVALTMDDRIKEHIGTIYIMGGALSTGNRTPVAEANFYDDPEAAEIVLTSGCRILLNPIEPNLEGASFGREELLEIGKTGTPAAEFVSRLLLEWIDRCAVIFGSDSGKCCIHDFAAVAPLIDPETVTESREEICHVDISGGMSDGMLVVDRRTKPAPGESSVELVYHMDERRTHGLLKELLS
ncbi:MAG: nucleoside hydrolase [Oscillospiraceae bacterium]|jgi:inosine-uridine nucleoside N-ribohydrolase